MLSALVRERANVNSHGDEREVATSNAMASVSSRDFCLAVFVAQAKATSSKTSDVDA